MVKAKWKRNRIVYFSETIGPKIVSELSISSQSTRNLWHKWEKFFAPDSFRHLRGSIKPGYGDCIGDHKSLRGAMLRVFWRWIISRARIDLVWHDYCILIIGRNADSGEPKKRNLALGPENITYCSVASGIPAAVVLQITASAGVIFFFVCRRSNLPSALGFNRRGRSK